MIVENEEEKYLKDIKEMTPNVNKSVYAAVFGKQRLKEKVDCLLLGFFIGYYSTKLHISITEQDLNIIIFIYKDNAEKIHSLNDLVQILFLKYNEYFKNKSNLQNKIVADNNHSLINNNNSNNNNFIDINNDDNSEEEIKDKSMIKCPICFEEYDVLDELNYCLDCNCIIHYSCFDKHIVESINQAKIPIKCPICNKEVNSVYIYDSLKNANPELIEKYENLTMDYYVSHNMKNMSYCPTPGCSYVFFFEKNDDKFICPLCEKSYCLKCKSDWHEGISCQENRKLKNIDYLDQKFENLRLKMNYKQCPNCFYWIEKTEGCNHMTCRCGYQFCYNCGAEFLPGHQCYKNYPRPLPFYYYPYQFNLQRPNMQKLSVKERRKLRKENRLLRLGKKYKK